MFGQNNYYYHAKIRSYVALFGTLFSDLYIARVNGTKTDYIKVPLKFGPGFLYEKAKQDDSRETKKMRQILPAMAFDMVDLQKDGNRKTNDLQTIQNSVINPDGTTGNFQMNRVPYNFSFELVARTKNVDDMLQIAEQIIPAFSTPLNIKFQDIAKTEIDIEQNIVVSLDSVQKQDNYEETEEARIIEWTFSFILKGYLYKKTNSDYVIKEIDLYYYADPYGTGDPTQSELDAEDVIKAT